jgi:hypothetical protein
MSYLTYDEYVEIGGTLDYTAFTRNIDRACGFVDSQTFSRIKRMSEIPRMAKACIRDLVEYVANNFSNVKSVTSRSQSAGGVSESESYSVKSIDDLNSEMLDIVYSYLSSELDDYGVPLMYRGASNISHNQDPKEPVTLRFQVKYGLNEIEIPR